MRARTNLLVHIFDKEVLDLYSTTARYSNEVIKSSFRSALKIAYLFCPGKVLLPLSSYFESDLMAAMVDEWGELFAAQDFQIVSSELDFNYFIELKREQYKREPKRHRSYYDKKVAFKLRDLALPVARRNRSSTQDIAHNWKQEFTENLVLIDRLAKLRNTRSSSRFERQLIEVPERLAGDAFIWDYAFPLLPVHALDTGATFALKALISRSYVRSYLDEFVGYAIYDLSVGDLSCDLRDDEIQSIRVLVQIMRFVGIADDVRKLDWSDILKLRDEPVFQLFAHYVRAFSTMTPLPLPVLRANEAARRKVPKHKGKEHILRVATIFSEEWRMVHPDASPTPLAVARPSLVRADPRPVDWDQLIGDLSKIKPGRLDAHEYENAIVRLLTSLFYPVLDDPRVQTPLHERGKRVDILFRNMANEGFFAWLPEHYPAAYIPVECKNYAGDIGNPELDQLSGRFSDNRGRFGFLVCRKILDYAATIRSCWHTAADQRNFIIPLADNDLIELVKSKKEHVGFFELPLIKKRFDQLVHRSL